MPDTTFDAEREPPDRAPGGPRPGARRLTTTGDTRGGRGPSPAGLDHVGVAVPGLDSALVVYHALLGLEPAAVEEVASEGVRVAFLPLTAGGTIELLEPLGPDTTVGRFLARRGPGVHHLSFRVADCHAAIQAAEAAGVRALPPAPRRGSRGSLVAFFDPRDTGGVLIEVCQEATPI